MLFVFLGAVFLVLASDAIAAEEDAWTSYQNGRFGYRVEYPDLYPTTTTSDNGDGVWMESENGEYKLTLSGGFNVLKQDGNAALKDRMNHVSHIVPGTAVGGANFYRVVYSDDGGKDGNEHLFHEYGVMDDDHWATFLLVYPLKEETRFAAFIPRMEKALTLPSKTGEPQKESDYSGYSMKEGHVFRGNQQLDSEVHKTEPGLDNGIQYWSVVDNDAADGGMPEGAAVLFFAGSGNVLGAIPLDSANAFQELIWSPDGGRVLVMTGSGLRPDVFFTLYGEGLSKQFEFSGLRENVVWLDDTRFAATTLDGIREESTPAPGLSYSFKTSVILYDAADNTVHSLKSATDTMSFAFVSAVGRQATLVESSVKNLEDWNDEKKIRQQEFVVSIPPAKKDRVIAVAYMGKDFTAASWEIFRPGSYNLWDGLGLPNDSIVSIRVKPGHEVILYEHANFEGQSLVVEEDRNLEGIWLREVSSLRVKEVGSPEPDKAKAWLRSIEDSGPVFAVSGLKGGREGLASVLKQHGRSLQKFAASTEAGWYGFTAKGVARSDDERIAMAGELLTIFQALGYGTESWTPAGFAQQINNAFDWVKTRFATHDLGPAGEIIVHDRLVNIWRMACLVMNVDPRPYEEGLAAGRRAGETRIEVTADALKRMGVFLSNFTELGFMNFKKDAVGREDLIRFGIWHNYRNNYKSRIAACGVKDCPHGSLVIDGKYVGESIKKYFAIDFKEHGSVMASDPPYYYDGKGYHFEGADGESTCFARVKEVFRTDSGRLRMIGDIYNADDETDLLGTFEALALPYQYNGKATWSILALKTAFSGEK